MSGSTVNGLEELLACLVELLGGLIVAVGSGDCIWLSEGNARLEEGLGGRQGFQLPIRGQHVLQPVFLPRLAFLVGDGFGKETGAVEVNVGVQEPLTPGIDLGGKALRNMAVAQVFAHDRPVFGLRQPVVVAVPGSGFGELHTQLLQELGHCVIDVLRAVVRVKAQDLKRKAFEQGFDGP